MVARNCPECGKIIKSTKPGVAQCGNCGESILVNGSGFGAHDHCSDPENRRNFHRYSTSHRVLLRTIDTESNMPGMFMVGQLENLSGGGALVIAEDLPQVGETVEVVLATSDKSLMRMTADICHRHVGEKNVAVGLHFQNLNSPSQHCVVATAKRLSNHRQVS